MRCKLADQATLLYKEWNTIGYTTSYIHKHSNSLLLTFPFLNLQGIAKTVVTKIEDCRKYYPCIGLHSHGEQVTINAGRKRFAFDIGKYARSLSKGTAWLKQESEFYLETDAQSGSSTVGLFSLGGSNKAPQWEKEREKSINVNPLARIVENIGQDGADKDEDLIAYCREVLRGKQFQGTL